MRIAGEWLTADDGVTRPIVHARVGSFAGQVHRERFLIDTGADRTVLGAAILSELGLPVEAPPPGAALRGIGGETEMVLVATTLEFARDDGGTARVLDHFDVIVSRRRDEVLLLASSHRYSVTPT
jgi:hypothetical protein